jgi:hypothetical protein
MFAVRLRPGLTKLSPTAQNPTSEKHEKSPWLGWRSGGSCWCAKTGWDLFYYPERPRPRHPAARRTGPGALYVRHSFTSVFLLHVVDGWIREVRSFRPSMLHRIPADDGNYRSEAHCPRFRLATIELWIISVNNYSHNNNDDTNEWSLRAF